MAQSCGRARVSYQLAELLKEKVGNVRQRLWEWNWGEKDKAGEKRDEI